MSSRIAPRDTSPSHSVEAGYLRDLIVEIKRALHGLPLKTSVEGRLHLVASWGLTHREQVARCSQYNGDLKRFAEQHHPHEKDIAVIDAFVVKVAKGFGEGSLAKYITQEDIDAAEKAERAIYQCQTRMVWYR